VLPFTFGLDPLQGLAAMTGVYVGGSAGGLVTAVLLGIPGTPSAIATNLRRLPDGEEGRAGARDLAGRLGLVLRRPGRRRIPHLHHRAAGEVRARVRPWEFFALFVFALSMVAGLVESSLAKGLLSGGLGLIRHRARQTTR